MHKSSCAKFAKHQNSVATFTRTHTYNSSKSCTLLYSIGHNINVQIWTSKRHTFFDNKLSLPTKTTTKKKTLMVPYIRPVKLFPTMVAQETLKCGINSLLEPRWTKRRWLFVSQSLAMSETEVLLLDLKAKCFCIKVAYLLKKLVSDWPPKHYNFTSKNQEQIQVSLRDKQANI